MSFTASESLQFGDVRIACVASPELTTLNVRRVACAPALPKGMAVEFCEAYVVHSSSPHTIHSFEFELTLLEFRSRGSAESGEHLDAQSWQIGDGLLMIGTEDGEALRMRMPWLPDVDRQYPVEYLRNGFRLSIERVPASSSVNFHFVLAYNQTECDNQSEWFAVDIPHAKICEYPTIRRLANVNAV